MLLGEHRQWEGPVLEGVGKANTQQQIDKTLRHFRFGVVEMKVTKHYPHRANMDQHPMLQKNMVASRKNMIGTPTNVPVVLRNSPRRLGHMRFHVLGDVVKGCR